MSEQPTEQPVATTDGAPYVENPDFVPDPTNVYGTYNTSGTGAHEDPNVVSPLYAADRKAVAQQIVSALDPEDQTVDEGTVLFPAPQANVTIQDDNGAAKQALREKAQAVLDEGPVVVGGPAPAEQAAAESGEAGEQAADEQGRETTSEASAATS